MSKSESIVNLAKALFKFQSEVAKISRDSKNPFFKSRYASLHHILEKIDPVLSDAGLVLLQNPIFCSDPNLVMLETVLIHAESGEFIQSEYAMAPVKRDPQAFGSCITYMRRYALVSILKLNIDDNDDDGNEASATRNSGLTKKPEINKEAKEKNNGTFIELKDKLELCQSKEELAQMVSILQSSDLTKEDRIDLGKIYKAKSNQLG